jgi:membrane protein
VDPFPVKWPNLPDLLANSAARWIDHDAPRLGAALAFYTLLSITPIVVVVTAIGSLVFGTEAARRELTREVYAVAGTMGVKAVGFILSRAENPGHGVLATILGVVFVFLGASGVLIELRDALNTIWGAPVVQRTMRQGLFNLVRERFFASALVLGIAFFLLLSLAANVFTNALLHRRIGSSFIPFLVVTGLFAVIFKFVPDVRLPWIEVLAGALATSLLFEIGRLVIGFYLASADFNTTYGPAASVTALLVWVYYSSQIFFFGAAMTKELKMTQPDPQ